MAKMHSFAVTGPNTEIVDPKRHKWLRLGDELIAINRCDAPPPRALPVPAAPFPQPGEALPDPSVSVIGAGMPFIQLGREVIRVGTDHASPAAASAAGSPPQGRR
jgi:hypothetical protein